MNNIAQRRNRKKNAFFGIVGKFLKRRNDYLLLFVVSSVENFMLIWVVN